MKKSLVVLAATLTIFLGGEAELGRASETHLKPLPTTDGSGNVIFYPDFFEGQRIFQVVETTDMPRKYHLWVSPDHVVQHYFTKSLSENRLVWCETEWFEVSRQIQPHVELGIRLPSAHVRYYRQAFRRGVELQKVFTPYGRPPSLRTELIVIITVMTDDKGGFLITIERLIEADQKMLDLSQAEL